MTSLRHQVHTREDFTPPLGAELSNTKTSNTTLSQLSRPMTSKTLHIRGEGPTPYITLGGLYHTTQCVYHMHICMYLRVYVYTHVYLNDKSQPRHFCLVTAASHMHICMYLRMFVCMHVYISQ